MLFRSGTNQDCPATAAKAVTGAVATMTDKNPFDTTKAAVKAGTTHELGYVNLNAAADIVTVKTCIATGACTATTDIMTSTITVD